MPNGSGKTHFLVKKKKTPKIAKHRINEEHGVETARSGIEDCRRVADRNQCD